MAKFPLLPIPTPVRDRPQVGPRGRSRDCIGGVSDQLEDGEPGRPDKLVPEKLKNASPRPELHAQRRVAGLHSRVRHASDPRLRMHVEHPFAQETKVAPGRREESRQPAVVVRCQHGAYPRVQLGRVSASTMRRFNQDTPPLLPRQLQSFRVQVQNVDGTAHTVRDHARGLARIVVHFEQSVGTHPHEGRKLGQCPEIDECVFAQIRFACPQLMLAGTGLRK